MTHAIATGARPVYAHPRPVGAAAGVPAVTVTDQDEAPTCEHRGCSSGEPTAPDPLFPGGPLRPARWGGAGPGLANLRRRCRAGRDFCCGRCGEC